MRSVPSDEEKRFYEDNGFVRVDPFLSSEELDEWRRVVDEAVVSRGGQRFSIPVDEGPGSAVRREPTEDREYYDRVFIQRVNLWQTDGAFQKLLFQKELGQFVGEMAGVEGLRVWHDQALIKQPYANPTAFHLDVPYWSFTSPDAITIWIALDDATLENGCLYYVPGSHKAQKFDNVDIGKEIGALFDVYPEWRDVAPAPCPGPRRRSITPQWAYVPWRRRKYDTRVAPGHHLRLYARRVHLQRTTKCLAARVLEEPVYRGPARLRRTEPTCFRHGARL